MANGAKYTQALVRFARLSGEQILCSHKCIGHVSEVACFLLYKTL
jgi:hypothetical protein